MFFRVHLRNKSLSFTINVLTRRSCTYSNSIFDDFGQLIQLTLKNSNFIDSFTFGSRIIILSLRSGRRYSNVPDELGYLSYRDLNNIHLLAIFDCITGLFPLLCRWTCFSGCDRFLSLMSIPQVVFDGLGEYVYAFVQ